jgi:hypothetical protein
MQATTKVYARSLVGILICIHNAMSQCIFEVIISKVHASMQQVSKFFSSSRRPDPEKPKLGQERSLVCSTGHVMP